MLYRDLGSTREKVSAIGVGGYHLGVPHVDESLSIRIVRAAVDQGITFMDNCWAYNNGLSEVRMGKALRDGYRDKVFLMTRIDGRSKKEAAKQLDESLRRPQVDHVDLVQHHEVLRFEDPHRIFHHEGANAALVERGIGILGMKSMADGHLLKTRTVTPTKCLHYALDLPASVVITGIDSLPILSRALSAVRSFRPLGEAQRVTLLARTARAAARGDFEPFKTTARYDATAADPSLVGEEPEPAL